MSDYRFLADGRRKKMWTFLIPVLTMTSIVGARTEVMFGT